MFLACLFKLSAFLQVQQVYDLWLACQTGARVLQIGQPLPETMARRNDGLRAVLAVNPFQFRRCSKEGEAAWDVAVAEINRLHGRSRGSRSEREKLQTSVQALMLRWTPPLEPGEEWSERDQLLSQLVEAKKGQPPSRYAAARDPGRNRCRLKCRLEFPTLGLLRLHELRHGGKGDGRARSLQCPSAGMVAVCVRDNDEDRVINRKNERFQTISNGFKLII